MFQLTLRLSLIWLCAIAILSANVHAQTPSLTNKQNYLRILTGAVDSFSYALGSALSVSLSLPKTIECKENCGISGLLVSALSSPSDRDTLQAILNKNDHSGFVALDSLWNSKISDQQRNKLRIITPLHRQSLMVITHKNNNIKRILDLKGKKIFFDMANTNKMNLIRDFFSYIGLKREDYRPSQGYYQQALHDFKEQKLDALILFRAVPDIFLTSLSHEVAIKFIGFNVHDINIIKQQYPYVHTSFIPAKYYDNNRDIKTIAIPMVWVTHQEQNNALIFEITKKYRQSYHHQELQKYMPILPLFYDVQHSDILGLEYHQGALKYYQ